MGVISIWRRLVRAKVATDVNSVVAAGGGTSALLTKDALGTRDFALVEAEKLGLLTRSARMGRIDFYRYGRVFDFTLTPKGDAARKSLKRDVSDY